MDVLTDVKMAELDRYTMEEAYKERKAIRRRKKETNNNINRNKNTPGNEITIKNNQITTNKSSNKHHVISNNNNPNTSNRLAVDGRKQHWHKRAKRLINFNMARKNFFKRLSNRQKRTTKMFRIRLLYDDVELESVNVESDKCNYTTCLMLSLR